MLDDTTIDRMLTSGEAGTMLGMRKSWLYEQATRGTIPCYRFGRSVRFRMSDVQLYMATRRVDACQTHLDGAGSDESALTSIRGAPSSSA